MPRMSGSSSKDLDVSIQRCWTLVADVASAPSWQRGLELVEMVTRDEHGRPSVCDTVSDAKITKVRVRVQFEYEPPRRLTWSQLESDGCGAPGSFWTWARAGRGRPTRSRSIPARSAALRDARSSAYSGRWSSAGDPTSSPGRWL